MRNQPTTVRGAAYWEKHATDTEVSNFLKRVADPRYVDYRSRTEPDEEGNRASLDNAFALLARLVREREDCTCYPRPSGRVAPAAWAAQTRQCPNYVEGDDV